MIAFHVLAAAAAAACPANVANTLRIPPPASARQLVTVTAPTTRTTSAIARTWTRDADGCWTATAGPFGARVGWNGLRRNRHEGDGTTPIGTFAIGRVMYGNERNPGVKFRYRRLRCGDWWVEDPASRLYNTFTHYTCNKQPPFRTPTPDMSKSKRAYAFLAVIDFNTNPIVPGRGSGIFLHVRTGHATNGCVSLPRRELLRVLRWLEPTAAPHVAISVR